MLARQLRGKMLSMRRTYLMVWIPILLLALTMPHPAASMSDEPDVVVVQHILIGFKKSVPNKKLERTKREAAALALDLLERAQAGDILGVGLRVIGQPDLFVLAPHAEQDFPILERELFGYGLPRAFDRAPIERNDVVRLLETVRVQGKHLRHLPHRAR